VTPQVRSEVTTASSRLTRPVPIPGTGRYTVTRVASRGPCDGSVYIDQLGEPGTIRQSCPRWLRQSSLRLDNGAGVPPLPVNRGRWGGR